MKKGIEYAIIAFWKPDLNEERNNFECYRSFYVPNPQKWVNDFGDIEDKNKTKSYTVIFK